MHSDFFKFYPWVPLQMKIKRCEYVWTIDLIDFPAHVEGYGQCPCLIMQYLDGKIYANGWRIKVMDLEDPKWIYLIHPQGYSRQHDKCLKVYYIERYMYEQLQERVETGKILASAMKSIMT